MNTLKIKFLTFLFILLNISLFAQTNKIDSLKNLVQLEKNDTLRMTNLFRISFAYHQTSVDSCRLYANRGMQLAQDLGNKKGMFSGYNCKGIAAFVSGDLENAAKNFKEGLSVAKELDNKKGITGCANNLGLVYKDLGENGEALKHYQIALAIYEESNDNVGISTAASNIAILHMSMGNLDAAEKYVLQSLEFAKKTESARIKSISYMNVANYNFQREKYSEVLEYANEAKKIDEENNLQMELASTLHLIGKAENQMGFNEKAVMSLNRASDILESLGEERGLIFSIRSTLASVLFEMDRYNEAKSISLQCLEGSQRVGVMAPQLELNNMLSVIYEAEGNNKEALKYYKSAVFIKDSIYSADQKKVIAELDTKYAVEKQHAENELLRANQVISEAKLSKQKVISFSILGILLSVFALGFVLLKAYRNKNKYSKKLELEVKERTKDLEVSNKDLTRSNKELERFAFIASHDLKTPLRSIISFTDLLDKEIANGENEKAQEYIAYIKKGGKRMNTLIEDVLEYSKLSKLNDSENTKTDLIDLNKIVARASNKVKNYFDEKNTNIEILNPLPEIKADTSSIFSLFRNIIENGIKYNESDIPKIKIYSKAGTDSTSIFIEDNGIGIEQNYQEKIFTMFSRLHTHEKYEGTGLGLSSCKKIIEQLKGEILVSSKIDVGTTFEIVFPKEVIVSSVKDTQGAALVQ